MASIQCERKEEVQFSSEEKASLDEIMKHAEESYVYEGIKNEAHDIVAKHEGLCTGDRHGKYGAANRGGIRIVVVAGGLKNLTTGSLNILDSKKWSGYVIRNFPNLLDSMGYFSQAAVLANGVKAGVAYAGKNANGVDCAWLLAFADTTTAKRRIYAECGPKSKFNNIDWDKIEQKLVNAGEVDKAYDKETGTSVYAAIIGSGGKDLIAAAFYG